MLLRTEEQEAVQTMTTVTCNLLDFLSHLDIKAANPNRQANLDILSIYDIEYYALMQFRARTLRQHTPPHGLRTPTLRSLARLLGLSE